MERDSELLPELRGEGGAVMREYIITSEQLKTAIEAFSERELLRPITEVFISGDKLPEIVRCRDCIWYDPDYYLGKWCKNLGFSLQEQTDGFCKWGERRGK